MVAMTLVMTMMGVDDFGDVNDGGDDVRARGTVGLSGLEPPHFFTVFSLSIGKTERM